MQSLDQLFVHELQDVLSAEQTVADALSRFSQCASDPRLQQVFETHLAETRNQIDRLHQVFSMIGRQPTPIACEGAIGIVREHDRFVQENQPAPQIHAVFDVGAGQKVEQYEIAAYEELVEMASALGYHEAANLFQTTLAEERQQRERLRNVSNAMDLSRLAPQTAAGGEQPQPRQPVSPGPGQG